MLQRTCSITFDREALPRGSRMQVAEHVSRTVPPNPFGAILEEYH